MTYIRSWKSHRHTWLGLNPQIGRPLSRIVGAIGRNAREFSQCAVDFDGPNQVTTKMREIQRTQQSIGRRCGRIYRQILSQPISYQITSN
jgi:hypothetical protein